MYKLLFIAIITYIHCFNAFASNDLDFHLQSYIDLDYKNSELIEEANKFLESKFHLMNPEQKVKFGLYNAYYLGVSGNHKERLKVLNSMDLTKVDNSYYVKYLYQLTESYISLSEFEKALDKARQLSSSLEDLDDSYLKMLALLSISQVYNRLYMFEDSLKISSIILDIGIEEESSRILCYGYSVAFESKFMLRDYEYVVDEFSEALKNCNDSNETYVSDLISVFNMSSKLSTNPEDIAWDELKNLHDFVKTDKNHVHKVYLEMSIGDYFEFNNDYETALYWYGVAYTNAKNHSRKRIIALSVEKISSLYFKVGDYVKAYEFASKSSKYFKDYADDVVSKSLLYNASKIKAKELEIEMKRLSFANENLRVKQEVASERLKISIYLGVVAVGLLGLAFVVLVILYRQRKNLKKAVDSDALTNVLSRSRLITQGKINCAKYLDEEKSFTLITFDMDNFKSINDRFGHAVGDWVLTTVCHSVKSNIRKSDFIGRLGGEEFVIGLPNTSLEQGIQLAERCRLGLEKINCSEKVEGLAITASFGVAQLSGRVDTFEKLLAEADQYLYKAKESGRNCVAFNNIYSEENRTLDQFA